jgi:hypothetical protein
MRLARVRDVTALVLIAGHLLAFALIFTRMHRYLAEASDKLELVLILSPLTGLFALAGVRHFLADDGSPQRSQARVTAGFALTAIGIPLFFTGFINYTLFVYPFGVAEDPKSLRLALAGSEAGLGALLGAVAEKLFGVNIAELRKEIEKRRETT